MTVMSDIHIFAKKKTELTALDRNGLHLKMKKLSELNIEKPLTVGDKKKASRLRKCARFKGTWENNEKNKKGFAQKSALETLMVLLKQDKN